MGRNQSERDLVTPHCDDTQRIDFNFTIEIYSNNLVRIFTTTVIVSPSNKQSISALSAGFMTITNNLLIAEV